MRYLLGNEKIERTWEYKDKNLYTVSLKCVRSGHEYIKEPLCENDFFYEGLTYETLVYYKNNRYLFDLVEVKETYIKDNIYTYKGKKLSFELFDEYHGIRIFYNAILYDDASAIRIYLDIETANMPTGYFFSERYNAIDTIPVSTKDMEFEAYEFFTRTDHNNYLVEKHIPKVGFEKGNLLLAKTQNGGLYFLKESPCFYDQRPECSGNYYISHTGINILGWGIMPHEFQKRIMTTYSSIVGVYEHDRENAFRELKLYQKKRSKIKPTLVANPWGGGKWMEHVGEDFIIKEIRACKELGAEYYQIDDGWNEGFGLIHVGYSKKMDKDFWNIKKDLFKEGFHPLIREAEKAGVQIALWIGPDCNTMYRNWREQADIIYDMYTTYGIKLFKIDIMKLRSKESEENIENMFKYLREKSDGSIIFNFDVTADRRSGYFMFSEYGNIFLENRYTHKKTYYPHMTLKNLWDLSLYVPAQNIQIEFLNIDADIDKYEKNGLEPIAYPYSYVASIPFFANPLCWLEPSDLKKEALEEYSKVLKVYKKYRERIHQGDIYPVGMRPDGYSFTGFVSLNHDTCEGYLIAFRENHQHNKFKFTVPCLKGACITNSYNIINDFEGKVQPLENTLTVQLCKERTYIITGFKWEEKHV